MYVTLVNCTCEAVCFTGKELIFHRFHRKGRSSGHPLKVKIFYAAQDYHSHYGNTFTSLMKGSALE